MLHISVFNKNKVIKKYYSVFITSILLVFMTLPLRAFSTDVGMLYYIWQGIGEVQQVPTMNLEELLASGVTTFPTGEEGPFWHAKPDAGYYNLIRDDHVLRQHANQLRDMGVDFVVLDITNWTSLVGFAAETVIAAPMENLLSIWSTVPGAPKVVPWVPFENLDVLLDPVLYQESMVDYVTDLMNQQYPSMRYFYKGKPLLLAAADAARYPNGPLNYPQFQTNWTVREMWGLLPIATAQDWSFLDDCHNHASYVLSNGFDDCQRTYPANIEQISVAAAYQKNYMSYNGGNPDLNPARKFYGRTLVKQFENAFTVRPDIVFITGWNEWIMGRFEDPTNICLPAGCFVDSYDFDTNRDLEPGGVMKDYYYRLVSKLIRDYKNNLPFNEANYYLTEEALFDANYYANTYPDLLNAFGLNYPLLWQHWVNYGKLEGRSPNASYNPQVYRAQNPDLSALSYEQLFQHFIAFGFYEGRVHSNTFHAPTYLTRYADLSNAYGERGYHDALLHWTNWGQNEGRNAAP